jgi:choline dehydrogenase-like flavoprotein
MVNAGLRVLMIEKGPARTDGELRTDSVFGPPLRSALRGDELKYAIGHYLMPDQRAERRELVYSEPGEAIPKPQGTSRGWMSQLVGGGSVHYGGASFRQYAEDFTIESTFGDVLREHDAQLEPHRRAAVSDWPVTGPELDSWYDAAEKLIGIAGAPKGLPPLPFNSAGRVLAKAHKGKIEVKPTPMAINSTNHLGRPPCQNSGLCQDYACRFNAKSDMRVTLIPRMLETGLLVIRPNTIATKIEHNGKRATSISVVTRMQDGVLVGGEISAPQVVVACETLESNRLLLASSLGEPDLLGRRLMFHVTGGARGLAQNLTTTWDTAPHTSFVDHFYLDSSAGQDPFIKTGILLVSSASGPLSSVHGHLWGDELRRFFDEVYPYKMDLSYIGEGLPTTANRVELISKRDRFGMPGIRVVYQPHPMDLAAGRYIASKAKEMLKTAGARTEDDVVGDPFLHKMLSKATSASRLFHATGGCWMGEDPATSVTDETCRIHGFENVYVADGSVFPTGSGVNPTLTIQANALRVGSMVAGGN